MGIPIQLLLFFLDHPVTFDQSLLHELIHSDQFFAPWGATILHYSGRFPNPRAHAPPLVIAHPQRPILIIMPHTPPVITHHLLHPQKPILIITPNVLLETT